MKTPKPGKPENYKHRPLRHTHMRAIEPDDLIEPVSSLPKLDLPKGQSRIPYRCQADWCRQIVQPDHLRPGVCNFCETPIGETRSYKDL